MKTIKIIVAVSALCAAAPALAQANPAASSAQMDKLMRLQAAKLGTASIDMKKAAPIYRGNVSIDPRTDPWRPVTNEQMQQTNRDPWTSKKNYSLRVAVDFDGDGHIDTAQVYNNSRQGAVVVVFGGPRQRPPLVVFKSDRRFEAGEEILTAGRNRILVNIPDARQHLLFWTGAGPRVVTYGD